MAPTPPLHELKRSAAAKRGQATRKRQTTPPGRHDHAFELEPERHHRRGEGFS